MLHGAINLQPLYSFSVSSNSTLLMKISCMNLQAHKMPRSICTDLPSSPPFNIIHSDPYTPCWFAPLHSSPLLSRASPRLHLANSPGVMTGPIATLAISSVAIPSSRCVNSGLNSPSRLIRSRPGIPKSPRLPDYWTFQSKPSLETLALHVSPLTPFLASSTQSHAPNNLSAVNMTRL